MGYSDAITNGVEAKETLMAVPDSTLTPSQRERKRMALEEVATLALMSHEFQKECEQFEAEKAALEHRTLEVTEATDTEDNWGTWRPSSQAAPPSPPPGCWASRRPRSRSVKRDSQAKQPEARDHLPSEWVGANPAGDKRRKKKKEKKASFQ